MLVCSLAWCSAVPTCS